MRYVSRCCGCSYEDSFISDWCNVEMYKCNKFVIIVPSSKVDNLTMEDFNDKCPSCKKDTTTSGYICNECGNWFEELEEDYEHEERMKESYQEMMRDGEKDER